MTKKRATIIISGKVQDAGFRGKVMRIAQKAELLGYVENLANGTVRALCEGPEEVIKEFVEKLDIHDEDIDVENTSVQWSDATGEFNWFEVKFDNLGMEMFQGFATAGKKLSDVSNKVDSVGHKIEAMHTDLKEGFSDLKNESIKTHEKLDRIANASVKTHEKLDRIANASVKTHEKLDNVSGKLDNIDNRLGDALDRYDVFGQKMISIETEMKEFTKQITRLVDHLVESKTQEK